MKAAYKAPECVAPSWQQLHWPPLLFNPVEVAAKHHLKATLAVSV